MSKTTYDAIAKFIGNNDKALINQVLNGLDFVNQVRVIRNASLNGTGLQKMTVQKGIRPLNLDVESRSGAHRGFTGRKLLVYTGMKIIDIIPEEAERTFMSDMLAPGAKDIPFAQWVWQQEFAKIGQEINDNIYTSTYKGDAAVFNALSTYAVNDYVSFGTELDIYKCVTITTAGQSPSSHPAKWQMVNESVISAGWGTIIANEITASTITPIVTGAINNTNALAKIELMYNGMTVAHRNLGGTFKVSPSVYRAYIENERTVYGPTATPDMGTGKKTVYGDPKWSLELCTWMGTSQRIIATPKDNLVFGTYALGDEAKAAKVIETLHGYRTVVKWRQGCEIADLEVLYVNEQP